MDYDMEIHYHPGKANVVVDALSRCHTPFQERGNEASIRVSRMFKSHI
jgi:hypothetical protein